jgi:hypothetical protein
MVIYCKEPVPSQFTDTLNHESRIPASTHPELVKKCLNHRASLIYTAKMRGSPQ